MSKLTSVEVLIRFAAWAEIATPAHHCSTSLKRPYYVAWLSLTPREPCKVSALERQPSCISSASRVESIDSAISVADAT